MAWAVLGYFGRQRQGEENQLGLRAPCASIGRMIRSLNSPIYRHLPAPGFGRRSPNYSVQILAALRNAR
jgi:hypothetical protein